MKEGRFVIDQFIVSSGQPEGPHARRYVNHCGAIVRERIPITSREWNYRKSAPNISYVTDVDKEALWTDITTRFSFQTDRYHEEITHEQLVARVRKWTMEKMAEQFRGWKKDLFRDYVKKNITPDWNNVEGPITSQRPFWNEFVEYKLSQESLEKSRKNQVNALKKQYHHNLGSGGYGTLIPKVEKLEQELVNKGITPETLDWPSSH